MSFKSVDERINVKLRNVGFQETRPIYDKFKKTIVREGEQINEHFTQHMEKYQKEHGDGNPVYTLDKFSDPNFRPCPAFFSSNQTIINYLRKQSTKAHKEYDGQIQNQLTCTNIAWKYSKHD